MKLTIARVGSVSVFRIGGKVGWENSRVLDSEVRQAIEGGIRFLVFDLDDVEFLSSGAIGVLVYHLRKLQGGQGDILVVASNSYVLYLFKTIGFHRVFEGRIFQDAAGAASCLGSLGQAWDPSADLEWKESGRSDDDDDERSLLEENG